ncbi:hypothetical protein Tco_0189172 [Tanacetum coccineum]
MGYKKKAVVVTSDPLVLVVEKTKVRKGRDKVVVHSESEESDDEDISDLKKDYCVVTIKKPEYVKSDQEISVNMVFMAKTEKILSDLEESSSSAEETIAEVSYYTSDSESEYEYETSDYYDYNETTYGLFVDNGDDQEIFHDATC